MSGPTLAHSPNVRRILAVPALFAVTALLLGACGSAPNATERLAEGAPAANDSWEVPFVVSNSSAEFLDTDGDGEPGDQQAWAAVAVSNTQQVAASQIPPPTTGPTTTVTAEAPSQESDNAGRLGAAQSGPGSPSDLDLLKRTGWCRGCNLRGLDISGLALTGSVDLTGADLSGAYLYNNRWENVNLTGATFGVDDNGDPTTVAYTTFTNPFLGNTTFDRTVFVASEFTAPQFDCPAFTNTSLLDLALPEPSSARLCGEPTFNSALVPLDLFPTPSAEPGRSLWANSMFERTSFYLTSENAAHWRGTALTIRATRSQFLGAPADFTETVFNGSTLDGTSFFAAVMPRASFAAANGRATSAVRTNFSAATLTEANFTGADLRGSVFVNTSAQRAKFSSAELGPSGNGQGGGAVFAAADLRDTSFNSVAATGADFTGAYLFSSSGTGAATTRFDNARSLANASFVRAVMGNTSFVAANAAGANFDGAQCVLCDFTRANLTNGKFVSAWLYGMSITGAVLDGAVFENAACCTAGTWIPRAAPGAGAPTLNYQVGPMGVPAGSTQPTPMGGGEFQSVAACPNGRPGTPNGCAGEGTKPAVPPGVPACQSAGAQFCTGVMELLAGNGAATYNPGGPLKLAKQASLHSPTFMAMDTGADTIFVADTANSRVRAISGLSSTDANIVDVVGNGSASPGGDSGPARAAGIAAPTGVAVSRRPDFPSVLAVADSAANTVRAVPANGAATGDGTISTVVGNGQQCADSTAQCGDGGLATQASLNNPQGLWFDPVGNLYIADRDNNRIRRVDAVTAQITTVAGNGLGGASGDGGPATEASLNAPNSVVGDGAGNLYISDTGNNSIRRVSPGGQISTVGQAGAFSSPTDVRIDSGRNLYVVESAANRVSRVSNWGRAIPVINATGTAGYNGDGANTSATDAQLAAPTALLPAGQSTLYVADSGNNRVRMLVVR